jgi:hypothetical protein
MELGKVFVDDVVVGENRRPIDKAAVERLAESMKAIGLQTPISIWADDKDRPVLVAGHHRLEAARALGWEQIECCFVALSGVDREIWEISENLMRCDLTKEQRDKDIRRLAELLRERESKIQIRQDVAPEVGYKKPPPQRSGIAKKIADSTGLSKRTVERVLAPPKPVPPPAPARNEHEAFNAWCEQMNRLWGRAPQEWRERWLAQIDHPVFDQTEAA